jgi:myo-inositol-hexaphosphate 3-phosphohydrolase
MVARDDLVELIEVKIDQQEVKSDVKQYFWVEGSLKDYKLHPSNEYIIALNKDHKEDSFYYIFNIKEGDIRGKHLVPKSSSSLDLDPSGLYLSMIVDSNKVHIYELAKCTLISEIATDLITINLHRFGGTGDDYLVVNSATNTVKFYKIDPKLSALIKKV